MKKYNGLTISKGVAIGKAWYYSTYQPKVGSHFYGNTFEERAKRYHDIVAEAERELKALAERLSAEGSERADIVLVQCAMLTDIVVEQEILDALPCTQPDVAIDNVYRKYAAIMEAANDEIICARAIDFLDINLRLLRLLEGGTA